MDYKVISKKVGGFSNFVAFSQYLNFKMFHKSQINLIKCSHCTSSNKVVKNVSETPSESFASNYNFVAAFQPQKTNLQGSISLFSCPGAIKLFSPQLHISSNIVDKILRKKYYIFFLSPLHQGVHTKSNHYILRLRP